MYSLKQTLLDQKKLPWICRDIGETHMNREHFAQNTVFGTDLVFKEYCGLAPNYHTKAILPSGPVLYDNKPWSGYANYPIPTVMDCDPSKATDWLELGKTHFIPTACAFAYVIAMMRYKYPSSEGKGSIFFLLHSDRWLSSTHNYEALIDALESLPEKYKPITISLFWRDYLEGKHEQFPGYKIVSTGHRFDPVHFHRLYHLIRMHKYVLVNGWTMPPIHALLMNKPVRLLDAPLPQLELRDKNVASESVRNMMLENKSLLEGNAASNYDWIIEQFRDFDEDKPTTEQLRYADVVSGIEYIKDPNELKLDFSFAERLIRYEIK